MGNVMHFLSVPSWTADDRDEADKAIAWMNKGMTDNDWTWSGEHPIPREKRRGTNQGVSIDFAHYRTIHEVTGHKSFANSVSLKAKDMAEAAGRGRRMPKY